MDLSENYKRTRAAQLEKWEADRIRYEQQIVLPTKFGEKFVVLQGGSITEKPSADKK